MAKTRKSSTTMWTIAILLIVGVVALIIWKASGTNEFTPGSIDGPVDTTQEWTKGNPEAEVILIEYSDFQCPACAFYHTMVKEVLQEFDNHMLFVYRHFPLQQHKNAKLAGQAAEAAGQQEMFFEMHDIIFENQDTWAKMSRSEAKETFISYAGEIGVPDLEAFKKYLESSDAENAVEADFKSGFKAGVNSTPTFFLNGKKINNPRSNEAFRELIREKIQAGEDA